MKTYTKKTVRPYKRTRSANHMWTRAQLNDVITLWDSETVQALADRIGVTKNQVQQIATRFRKMGVKLARKRQNGYLETLMKEVARSVK